MIARYVDAHCHIQFDQYAHDETEIIGRMKGEGIVGIVVGVDAVSSSRAIALAEKYEHLYASVGLHPNHAWHPVGYPDAGDEVFDTEVYRRLANHPKVVAIGECGLDYFRPAEVNEDVKLVQKEIFKKHITLAAELDKPLIIHSRPSKGTQNAYHDVIELLKEAKSKHPKLRGDIHFFVGGVEEARALIALDFTISFTAVITFTHDYDEVIRSVPLTSILSETDSPYVAPATRRGTRNDPFSVVDVVSCIASTRGEDPEIVRETLLLNARSLFRLP